MQRARCDPSAVTVADNADQLGLAWYADLPTKRGIETTPLVSNGRLYATASWGHVLAYDARTGELLWRTEKNYGAAYSTPVDLIFGSNSELRAIAEAYAFDGADEAREGPRADVVSPRSGSDAYGT